MKKRIRLTIVSILLMLGVISILIINNNTETKVFSENGVKYALTLDGTRIGSIPSKGAYKATVTCTGATGKWLYDEWKLAVEKITSDSVTCSIDFTTLTKTYMSDYIIGLSGKTQGTGQVVNENGYRYEGKDPNNYVWFNNEYWRIIGVFDNTSHGQTGKNLVKLIRDEVLDGVSWNKDNTNNWAQSSLKKLLNESYYFAIDGTNSGNCYGYTTSLLANCDYTKRGIQFNYRDMVANVTWYIGGANNSAVATSIFYGLERGTSVYTGYPTTTTGYIGLMYPSDYGYSVLASSCARTTTLSSYNTAACVGQSWMAGHNYEWTITHLQSGYTEVFRINSTGGVGTRIVQDVAPRPVLYLKDTVYKIDGDGSLDNPYIIGM